MIRAFSLSVILFKVFVAADDSLFVQFALNPSKLLVNATLDDPAPPECKDVFKNPFSFPFQNLDLPKIVKNIDPLCKEYESIFPCFRALKKLVVQEFQDRIDESFGLFSFFCSPNGRRGLAEYGDSPCYNHNKTIKLMQDHVELCANSTSTYIDEEYISKCSVMRKMSDCGHKVFIEFCGITVADFLHEVTLLRYRVEPELRECFKTHQVDVDDHILLYSSRGE
jgi:hypothetical protein